MYEPQKQKNYAEWKVSLQSYCKIIFTKHSWNDKIIYMENK